jgi:hypothetical protein
MSIDARIPVATLDRYVRNFVEPGTLEQRVLSNMIMRNKGGVEFNVSGDNFKWPVKFRRVGNFRTHDVFQEVTVTPEKSEVMASESFGRYIQNEYIDEEEELINKAPEAIYDMSREKTDGMAEDGKDEFHLELHNGNKSGRRIAGLNDLLDTTYGTVHGLAQTGNVWWQHVILDAQAGPNTDADLDLLERPRTALITANRGDSAGAPDFGITDVTIYGKLVDAHQANERYTAAGNDISGELKFINVHNTPIYYDKQAQANVMRLLNSKKMKLLFRTPGMFKVGTKNPANRTGVMLLLQMFVNFIIKNPRYHAVIHNYGF